MKTVIEMAREVLLLDERDNPNDDGIAQFIGTLTDFAELVRADEREACAKVCESYRDEWLKGLGRYEFMGEGADFLADFIRARSET